MDWVSVGKRIRRQREFLGYTREALAEKLDVSPKFCSDIELGVKGMSVPTLCKLSFILGLSTDFILFGKSADTSENPLFEMLKQCPDDKKIFLEEIIKLYLLAVK